MVPRNGGKYGKAEGEQGARSASHYKSILCLFYVITVSASGTSSPRTLIPPSQATFFYLSFCCSQQAPLALPLPSVSSSHSDHNWCSCCCFHLISSRGIASSSSSAFPPLLSPSSSTSLVLGSSAQLTRPIAPPAPAPSVFFHIDTAALPDALQAGSLTARRSRVWLQSSQVLFMWSLHVLPVSY